MFPAAARSAARAMTPLGRPPDQPSAYCPIPQRLITDLHDNPLAIGVYSLIARLYLVAQSPIPLSVPDVLRYDPTLSRGAVLRALARLLAGGYIIQAEQPGRKTRYTPAWGRIGGAALAWNMVQPCLGRPRHIGRLRLDRRLLDICMGKLVPHVTRAAVITRYITTPVLSLSDIGCYALTLAGVPRTTPALIRLGAVRDGATPILPSDEQLLALISQRALDFGEQSDSRTELTISGTRKLGITPLLVPNPQTAIPQPLFFVPPGMIGSLIDPMIGSMIGSEIPQIPAATAVVWDERPSGDGAKGITWESRDQSDQAIPPPTPQCDNHSGGGAEVLHKARSRRLRQEVQVLPNTEAATALHAINVKPAQIAELAHMPLTTVETAIADGRARPGVRDLAGWVVSLLRAHRDYGWRITPPAPAPDSPEALRDAFAHYASIQEAELRIIPIDSEQALEEPPPAEPTDPAINIKKLWNIALATLQVRLPRAEFNTWIRRCSLSITDDSAIISTPNAIVKDGLERRYAGMLRDLIGMLIGFPIQLWIVIGEQDGVVEPDDTQRVMPTSGPDPLQAAAPIRSLAQRTTQSEVAQQPDWITAERWTVLPPMLRAALLGSTLSDGTVQTISPYLDQLIATRYTPEVAALIAAAAPLISAGNIAPDL